MSDNNQSDNNMCINNNNDESVNDEFNINDLENLNLNSINPDDINKILNNLGDGENNLDSLINNFTKGNMGSLFQNLGDIMSKNTNNNSDNSKLNEDDSTDEFDINENNLNDECDDELELNLDKFFISSTGKNICDVLLEVKSELQNINETVKKTLEHK